MEQGAKRSMRAAALSAALASAALSGCGHSRPGSSPIAASRSDGTSTTSSVSTGPLGPAGSGYRAARAQWLAESLVGGGAAQDVPYQQAVADLQAGESTDTGDRSGYPRAIATLQDLETLPDANATPTEEAEFNQWTAELNVFFDTPTGTQDQCPEQATPASRAAAMMWAQEPTATSSGIVLGPLRASVRDLEQAPLGRTCYAAVIADLQGLETATASEIAATSPAAGPESPSTMLVGGRIIYLNIFFAANGDLGSTWSGVLNH